jgi:hypothetical protein
MQPVTQRHTLGVRPCHGCRIRVPPGSRHRPKVWYGLPFGAAVWAGGYVVLPQLGVYKRIWDYDLGTLRKDLTAHLVFGRAPAAAFDLLTRGETGREGSGNS